MPNVMNSLLFEVAAVLVVSAAYGWWLWTRFRVGRYDGLCCSAGIVCMQLISAFQAQNPPLALVATMYHVALVGAVFTASRSLARAKS
jgi:hypothetical protein